MLCKYWMLSPNCFVMEKEQSERNVRRNFYTQQQGQQQGRQQQGQGQQGQQQQQLHQPTNKNIMHFNESILIRTAMTAVVMAWMASIAAGDSGRAWAAAVEPANSRITTEPTWPRMLGQRSAAAAPDLIRTPAVRSASLAGKSSQAAEQSSKIPSNVISCEMRSLCGTSRTSGSIPRSQQQQQQQQQRQLPHQQQLMDASASSASFDRNCFCDDFCSFYGDCCKDHNKRPAGSPVRFPPRGVISCQRVSDSGLVLGGEPSVGGFVAPTRTLDTSTTEVYVVTRCPRDFSDDFIRQRCEETSLSITDRFYRLPVHGGGPLRMLYRNIYCALCTAEPSPTFWQANLRCGQVTMATRSKSNRTGIELLRTLIRAGCPISFSPGVREIGAFSQPSVRRCKVNIGRCDQSWTDKAVARKCRERTEYVYAGNRAFRNRDCALCNYVNETYLKCEDTRAAPSSESVGSEQVVLEEHIPFAVTLDSNRARAIVTEKLNGVTKRNHMPETVVDFPDCDDGHVYDPFSDSCRLLHCRKGQTLRNGQCVLHSPDDRPNAERKITPDRVTPPTDDNYDDEEDFDDDDDDIERQTEVEVVEVSVSTSATLVPQCPLVPVNNSDVFQFENGSLQIISTQRILGSTEYMRQASGLFVCVPNFRKFYLPPPHHASNFHHNLSPRYNFTMFHFDSSQRSLSFILAIVTLAAIFVHVIIYAAFSSALLNSTDGKCVFSFSASLFVGQLFYLFVIQSWNEFPGPIGCFIISEAAQYAFLSAFCWLNVLSIDVFRWLRYTDDVTSGYSYIADECCTRYFWYSLYAWTVPVIVVSGSTATVLLRVDGWHPLDARPPGCWVMGMSQLMIFALPVCLILAVNVALYVVAACKMCFETRQTREPSYRNKYKHRCVVCIQLSVVMGMTWMFAMIAGVSQWSFVWYLFMFFDLVQGVVVFVAFVCTKKVWRLFRQKGRVHRASQETIQSEQRKLGHMNGNHNHVTASLGKKRRPDRRKNVLMIETTI